MKKFLDKSVINEQKHKILSDSIYDRLTEQLDKMYAESVQNPTTALPYSKFKIFWETGDRSQFENEYFARRKRLAAAFMKFFLYGGEEYKSNLEDVIWAICDEYTWALPAHLNEEMNDSEKLTYIDLFAAETGEALAEVAYFVGDYLDAAVLNRLKNQINIRIIEPFESKTFHWETVEMNWSAVCGGSVGMTYILAAPERFDSQKARFRRIMECFLRGFGSDGVCREGLNYWTYGFGYFTYYAQMAYEFTNGEENLWTIPVVKKTAEFQQTALLHNNTVISFSDGARTHRYQGGLTAFLADIFPESISVPPLEYTASLEHDRCYRFAHFSRNFFWAEPVLNVQPAQSTSVHFFEDACWYVVKRPMYGFAAKGGNNAEPHNHNDLGSFLIAGGDGQLLVDLGSGEYTKDYFGAGRYNILCNRSGGHSLPIIDGHEQSDGADRKATMLCAENEIFSVDIAAGYALPDLISVVRTFTCGETAVILRDSFKFSGGSHNITERFITLDKPSVSEHGIIINNLILKAAGTPEIKSELTKAHSGEDLTVYTIDYNISDTEFKAEFIILK